MTHPWYIHALLVDPERVLAHLARMRAGGVVDAEPNAWQLALGVLRMWHRVVFRSETVGTSALPRRPTWRARLLEPRALRLPALLASRAVVPFDFTGLRSAPARLIDHLLGAHHDGNQLVFDLELLAGHGALDELVRRADAVLDGSDPRAAWLRDLAVYTGYHEHLAEAARHARDTGPRMTADEALDPDRTLRGLVAWCARQPATPAATLAAWRAGRFRLDGAGLPPRPPTRAELLAASPAQLAAYLAAGHPVEPAALAGTEYLGTSLGLPAWLERATWKTFVKAFVADGEHVRGWNVRVEQAPPYRARRTFGHFTVERTPAGTELDYGRGGAGRLDPLRALRDPLVALEPGSTERLLGVSLVEAAGVRLPTPSYFLLERRGPVAARVEPPARAARHRARP